MRPVETLLQPRKVAAGLAGALCLLLVACGGSMPHPGSRAIARAKAHASTLKAAPTTDPDLVAAVSTGHEDSPIEVRFALRQHPQAGVPAQLDVVLLPSAGIDRIFASFHGEEGIAVQSGAQLPALDRPEAGVPIAHPLTVVAPGDGIYYVAAVVLTDSGADSVTRSFTIPVIVGDGFRAAAPSALAAARAADSAK
jgi:hypothetical protein